VGGKYPSLHAAGLVDEFPWISCIVRDIDKETATREGIFSGEVVTYNFGL
jgi:hypothetical protein